MKRIILLIISVLILTGCSIENKSAIKKTVTNDYFYKEIISEGNYQIVDVRTKEEYEESHIKDAINIELSEIETTDKLDTTKTILVYCKSGQRSQTAYNTLKKKGYKVYNLGSIDKIDLEIEVKESTTTKKN